MGKELNFLESGGKSVEVQRCPYSFVNQNIVILTGIILRLLCFTYGSGYLSTRPELLSPLVSFKRLQDGVVMKRDGFSPYIGDNFHFQPVILHLFSKFAILSGGYSTLGFYIVVDCLTGYLLSKSALLYAKEKNRIDGPYLAVLVLKCYLLNPITIASTAILSFTLVNNLIVASFVFFFFRGNLYPCISLLAVSAHLSLYTVIGVASLFLRFPSNLQRFISILGLLVGFLTLVTGNWLLNGMDWSFISDTYGFMLRVDDLTPNAGVFWYFFTQVFEHFRSFYLVVFQINLLVYVVPLLLSIRKDSHLHLTITLLLVAVFSSYPTLNDSSIYLSLLPIFDQYKKYPRFTLVIGGTIVTCVILMPIMWHMWIVAGSGNANFYFAVTLIYNVSQIYLMMDLMFAYFRKEADDICANLVTPKTNFILY